MEVCSEDAEVQKAWQALQSSTEPADQQVCRQLQAAVQPQQRLTPTVPPCCTQAASEQSATVVQTWSIPILGCFGVQFKCSDKDVGLGSWEVETGLKNSHSLCMLGQSHRAPHVVVLIYTLKSTTISG